MALILIVDDRVTNRTIYSKLAQSIGEDVKVRAFGDPCEALDWLKGARPDLIVTDHDMPQIDGDEFISRFRALPHSAGVPIMMITVNDQRTLRLRALESGATDFLTTPIDHFEFLSRARNLLKLGQRAQVVAPAPREKANDDFAAETRKLLQRCGEAAPYALHVVEIDAADGAHFDAAELVAALRRQKRVGDMLGRIDRLRFLVLQGDVANAAEAEACARRLRELAAFAGGLALRVGFALPRTDYASPEARAVKCLREAMAQAGARMDETAAQPRWRFQPRIDLRSGAICGAQFLRDEEPADAGDAEALQAAFDSAAEFRAANRPLRFSLRFRLDSAGSGASAPLAASLFSKSRMPPDWLDLQLCAREALSQPQRAEHVARSLRSLGVGLTLDLGALKPRDCSTDDENPGARDEWSTPLARFAEDFRPTLLYSCGVSRPASIARLIRAAAVRRTGRAPVLVAANVASPTLLTPLKRAGVTAAQGPCFGAPFAARDLKMLTSAWLADETPTPMGRRA